MQIYIFTILLVWTVGLLIFTYLTIKRKAIGTILLDESDPDGPYFFMELDNESSMNRVKHQKFVILRVKIRK